MKEIKFKIWHIPSKSIQIVAQIDFNNQVLDIYGIDEPLYTIPFSDCDILQYTGLVDINNKEIYEGDICVIKNYNNQVKYSGIVQYADGAFRVIDRWGIIKNLRGKFRNIEIIGNCYQSV